MSGRLIAKLLLTTAMCALTACGGGGGGGGVGAIASTPPPPPTPTPTPTTTPTPPPPPPVAVKIFPDVTTSTDFTVLGLEKSTPTTQLSELRTDGFAVHYDAGTGGYVFTLPYRSSPGTFTSGPGGSRFWLGFLGNTLVEVLKPSNPDLALKYVTEVSYYEYEFGGSSGPFGVFAFGTATPQSGMPTTGSASYDALLRGHSLEGFDIGGTASLSFNFGAGTLSGHMDPVLLGKSLGLGRYDFTNTVYSAGSPTFSGAMSHSGTSDLGAFNGLFAGPQAQELMARWTAPYLNPATNKWSGMFGVWVGKKCC